MSDPNSIVSISTTPPKGLLESMAMRYDHAFGLSYGMTDEEIQAIKRDYPIMARQYYTFRERESLLTTMRQLHEEVVGKGFYKYD